MGVTTPMPTVSQYFQETWARWVKWARKEKMRMLMPQTATVTPPVERLVSSSDLDKAQIPLVSMALQLVLAFLLSALPLLHTAVTRSTKVSRLSSIARSRQQRAHHLCRCSHISPFPPLLFQTIPKSTSD